MNYMDILGYLKHLFSENQKHKLLLNEDQQKIFDYIFKPILSYNYIGTRYNGQNLSTKIKEKLIGVTRGKQSATIKKQKLMKLIMKIILLIKLIIIF